MQIIEDGVYGEIEPFDAEKFIKKTNEAIKEEKTVEYEIVPFNELGKAIMRVGKKKVKKRRNKEKELYYSTKKIY